MVLNENNISKNHASKSERTKAYSKPCQILFYENIFAKKSTLDIRRGSEYTSGENIPNLTEFHLFKS